MNLRHPRHLRLKNHTDKLSSYECKDIEDTAQERNCTDQTESHHPPSDSRDARLGDADYSPGDDTRREERGRGRGGQRPHGVVATDSNGYGCLGLSVRDRLFLQLRRSVPANRRRRNGRHHHHPERLPAGFDQRPAAKTRLEGQRRECHQRNVGCAICHPIHGPHPDAMARGTRHRPTPAGVRHDKPV